MTWFNRAPDRRRFIFLAAASIIAAPVTSLFAASDDEWLGPYPPLSVIYDGIEELVASRPGLAELEVIGTSAEGRPIYGVRVGLRGGVSRPEALYMANIHAGEVISGMVAMGTLRRLIGDRGKDPWITGLMERTDIYLVPILNPDGYHRVVSHGGKGGGLGTRKNARGVDLNRNFPLVPGASSRHPMAGNKRPGSSYYMGENELSEPETRTVAELARDHDFYVSFMGHSVAGKVLYPHCFANVPPRHQEEFIKIGEAYASRQNSKKYKVQQSYSWYPTLGDSDDFLYTEHGTLALTIEHGTAGHNLTHNIGKTGIFWIMNPADMDHWVMNDRDAVLAGIEAALEITGGKPYNPEECAPITS